MMDVRVDIEGWSEWWRPLIQWVLCVPHLLYAGLLTVASALLLPVTALHVAVTGRVPSRAAAFHVLTLRERVRAYACFFLLRGTVPPYATQLTAIDPGDDPLTRLTIHPPERAPRWAGLRALTLLGHAIVLVPVGAAMDLCYPLWMLLAAANRGWPPGVERFLVQVERWVLAVLAYTLVVTNERPRFGLEAYRDEAPAPA